MRCANVLDALTGLIPPSSGPASLHLLEQMIEGAAHLEFFLAALHMHYLTAAEVAADLLDRIDANHGGAMDLPEFVRVQLIDQLFDRLADEGFETAGLHSSVFVLGAEEQDVAGRDHPYIGAHAGLYPTHVFAWIQSAPPESLRQLRQQVLHRIRLLLEPRAQALASQRHPLPFRRLQQVIDRAVLEGADRVLVVGGDKDHMGPPSHRLSRLDAVHPG